MFNLLYADDKGRIYDHPELLAAARTGNMFSTLEEEEAIPLPEGASLVLIPEGNPVGVTADGRFIPMDKDPYGKPVSAVAALLPQGYTRTMLPAYKRGEKKPLPLFGYAAVGWKDDGIYVAAVKTDRGDKWNPVHYSTPQLEGLVEKTLHENNDNRIFRQLALCALEYRCFTAQNIFYRRWEGGIPVSKSCNAWCLGCISLQPAECCPSPQNRINFTPSVEEVVQVALPHLAGAEEGIISFGQGCEGEPSLAHEIISEAIRQIRWQTDLGTINMNTNAGFTRGIKNICTAGIDSLRVSTISAREDTYTAYYRPQGYSWQDVCSSVDFARSHGVYVSINLLTVPGLTDTEEELEALIKFIKDFDINMIQFRNLNIDPDYLGSKIPLAQQEVLGVGRFIEILKEEIPTLETGNYSRPVRR